MINGQDRNLTVIQQPGGSQQRPVPAYDDGKVCLCRGSRIH